jgi:predicted XRE-type DNA-binding protein
LEGEIVPTDSVLFPSGTGEPPSLTALDVTALQNVTDPWHRSRLAEESAKQLRALVALALEIRRDAVRELVDKHGAHHDRVARHLGVSRARVSQLVTDSTGLNSHGNTTPSGVAA